MARSRRRTLAPVPNIVPWPGPEHYSLLKDYRRIRHIQRELGLLAEPLIDQDVLKESAFIIGLMGAEGPEVRNNDEKNTFYDHQIHDGNGKNPTPLARLQPSTFKHLGPEAVRILEAMVPARLNIYQLETVFPGIGFQVKDLFLNRTYLLVDELLSRQPRLVGSLAVFRLIQMDGWCFNSGVQGHTFMKSHMQTLEIMMHTIKVGNIRPQEFDPSQFSAEDNLAWARALLRSWLRPGSVRLEQIEIPTTS